MTGDVRAERAEMDALVAGQTVCSQFQAHSASVPDLDALKWKSGDAWRALTWRGYADQVRDFANGLIALGLRPGEFLGILSSTRPEYYFADIGTLHAGGIPVSLYNTLAPEQIEYIVNHCEAVFAVVEDAAGYERFRQIRAQIPRLRAVIVMEATEALRADPWVIAFADVVARGQQFTRGNPDEFDRRWRALTPSGLATLIYTSGTTGPPKGVMITHYNVLWTTESLDRVAPRPVGTRHISYLPLAHIAERMAGLYWHIKGLSTCYLCPNPQLIAQYLPEVRPEYFLAVPRIWEKLYYGLTTAIAHDADVARRAAVQDAIAAGLEKVRHEQRGEPVPHDVVQRVERAQPITARIRAQIGLDAARTTVTGAAPIAPEIIEWFHAIGVRLTEVYGQSEGSGPTSWNRPTAIKIGTVEPHLPGVEVRLATDGELLVRGGNVTAGYYKEPALTAETFDADGWLHSGDIAEIDAEGFVRIVDRKKDIIITAGGKNLAPSNIENMLKHKPLIGQACVIGDRRPYVTALVVLDAESVLPWASTRGLPQDLAQLAIHPAVVSEVQSYVDEINQHLNNVERIKKFTILPREWSADHGELTPTMKMKRKVVNQQYADIIDRMYAATEA